jgi:hypothetical protein
MKQGGVFFKPIIWRECLHKTSPEIELKPISKEETEVDSISRDQDVELNNSNRLL